MENNKSRAAGLKHSVSKFGICHLCGSSGKLSFEHVPPEAAFNDQRVLEADIHALIGGDLIRELEKPTGKFNQRGAGKFTLCEDCNTSTGGWYARSYVEFARQVFPLCHKVSPGTTVTIQCSIRPLDVLKQILVMFCSASSPSFAQKHPRLVRYLLNPESRQADDQRVFVSLYDLVNSRAARQAGLTGRIDMGGQSHVFSEISFPPFNLVMSVSGGCPDASLFDITWFKEYAHRELRTVKLTLNNLAVNSYFPGDYRTFDELKSIT
jgi:hypothetical protein